MARCFLPPIGYTISRRYAAERFWLLFRPSLEVRLPVPARAASVARREVKEEDGVPSRPKQMVVKVGSGSSGYTFERKGAEWADVKAGSHDAAVPASVPNMPSLQLERPPSLAPDFELSDGAGS